LNRFTNYEYDFNFDTAAEKIHNGNDSYFYLSFKEDKTFFSTFQNASDQPLSFLLNYALFEYNVKYKVFSFFHIKLDQIANRTFNRESEHEHLKSDTPESIEFVRNLCLKQQYILDYFSELSISKIRLRGDSCVCSIEGVSFQLAWFFSYDRLHFTLSFTVNNIFTNQFEVSCLSEFLPILKSKIRESNLQQLYKTEQSYFLYQYITCHTHSIHSNEFSSFQKFIQKRTGIKTEEQEGIFIKSFDSILQPEFILGEQKLVLIPTGSSVSGAYTFHFSSGLSVQIVH
jgi:hypothetical protein